jgi:hypothetical protein
MDPATTGAAAAPHPDLQRIPAGQPAPAAPAAMVAATETGVEVREEEAVMSESAKFVFDTAG